MVGSVIGLAAEGRLDYDGGSSHSAAAWKRAYSNSTLAQGILSASIEMFRQLTTTLELQSSATWAPHSGS